MQPIVLDKHSKVSVPSSHLPKDPQREKVAHVANREMGVFSRFGHFVKRTSMKAVISVVQSAYSGALEKEEAEARNYLQKHVDGIEDLFQKLPPELSRIIVFLRQLGAPIGSSEIAADPQSGRKKLISSFIWIILGNLAKQVIAEKEGPIALSEFSSRAVLFLMHFFGDRFNQIEAANEGKLIDEGTFLPMAEELLAQILPGGRLPVDKFVPAVSVALESIYAMIQGKIQGKFSGESTDLSEISPLLKSVGGFTLKSIVERFLNDDESALAELSGQTLEQLREWTGKISQDLYQRLEPSVKDYLLDDPELLQRTLQAITTKLLRNAAQNMDRFIPDLPRDAGAILQAVQRNLQDAYADPNPEGLKDVSRYLIGLFLPHNVPYLHGFAVRYEEVFLPIVHGTIAALSHQLHESAHSIEDAKRALSGRIRDPEALIELVDQWNDRIISFASEGVMSTAQASPLIAAGLKVFEGFKAESKTAVKAAVWKIFVQMIPDPEEGMQWESSEVFSKILDRFYAFAQDRVRPITEALKEELDPKERLNRAKELSLPLMREFIQSFVARDLHHEIPLADSLRVLVVKKIEEALSEKIAPELVKSVDWAILHPDDPDLVEVLFAIKNQPEVAKGHLEEAQAQIRAKVDDADSLIGLMEQISSKGAAVGTSRILKLVSKKFLHAPGNVLLKPLQQPMETIIKGWACKVFARLIPVPPEGVKLKTQEIFPRILDQLFEFANGHIPNMVEAMKRDWQGLSKEEQKVRAADLTRPILKEFLKRYVSDDLAAELPLPGALRDQAIAQVENAINVLVADGLRASCSWLIEKQGNEEALDQMFHSVAQPSAPVKACHAAGKLLESMLPYQCREKHAEWAQEAFNAMKKFLPNGEPGQVASSTFMKMVDFFIKYVGDAASPQMKSILSFASGYMELALLKLVRQLGERIQKLDEAMVAGDRSALERALEMLMKELGLHLNVYVKNRKLFRKGSQKEMLDAFLKEGLLHQGMLDVPAKLEVFQKWSNQFLNLAGIKPRVLPVPEVFKEVIWDKLQISLLPALLLIAFEKLKDPQMLDQVVRIGLEKLSSDWNKEKVALDHIREAFFPLATADFKPKAPIIRQFDDPYQKELESKIGRIGHLAVRMQSTVLIGKVMGNPSIQGIVAQVAGQPLRGNLRAPSEDPLVPGKAVALNEMLGSALDAFVLHFMPCEKVDGKWNYFAYNDKGELNPAKRDEPDFSEICPKTVKEKKRAHRHDVLRRRKLKREVARGTARVIKDQLNMQLQAFANLPWDRLVDKFVKLLRAIVRNKDKDKVERGVRKFFWFLRRYIIFPVLAAVTLPIWLPVREVVNTMMAKKGKKQIDALKKEIHFNLAFRVVDELLEKLSMAHA